MGFMELWIRLDGNRPAKPRTVLKKRDMAVNTLSPEWTGPFLRLRHNSREIV